MKETSPATKKYPVDHIEIERSGNRFPGRVKLCEDSEYVLFSCREGEIPLRDREAVRVDGEWYVFRQNPEQSESYE